MSRADTRRSGTWDPPDSQRPGSVTVAPSQPSDPLVTLATQLAKEMRECWSRGEAVRAEVFLQRHPELGQQPTAAMEILYEEVLLREEKGEAHAWDELNRRFPEWRHHLDALQECHQVLQSSEAAPEFPAVGEAVGEYRLLAELGKGAQGRVFLASQPALANRPVVLKVTPVSSHEHLSLARLQHTHIVPLYAARDDSARRLRFLCMPYFGGATLADVLRILAPIPANERTGKQLVEAVDELQAARPAVPSVSGGARTMLGRMTYAQAVSWIGACCAEALHYAHERGLLHLDLKPSNLLIAADGQPMLLDFHLAHEPLVPGNPLPERLGGTPAYMAAEQRAAAEAVGRDATVTEAVDARADIYSLGALLYETLGGQTPYQPGTSPPLYRVNPAVSMGLSDMVACCLAPRPADRYPDAGALAADLRSHILHQPLRGVRNRSLAERWRKWRARQPAGLRFTLLLVAALCALVALALAGGLRWAERRDEARRALADADRQWREQHYADAQSSLEHGLAVLTNLPLSRDLREQLTAQYEVVRSDRKKADLDHLLTSLHTRAEQLRVLFGMELPASPKLHALLSHCRDLWDRRVLLRDAVGADRAGEVATDLTELAVLWSDLRVRLANPSERLAASREALQVLADARSLFGPSPVLDYEEARHRQVLGDLPRPGTPGRGVGRAGSSPAWEHDALGRSLLRSGDLQRAREELKQALLLQPHDCWSNYYYGLCTYQLHQYEDAALAFSVSIGAAPDRAGLYYNRALALSALDRREQALADYDRALRLDPTLSPAALNRGVLLYQEQRYPEATAGLQHALHLGAAPAAVYYNLALVDLAQNHPEAALTNARRALQDGPSDAKIRKLVEELERQGMK